MREIRLLNMDEKADIKTILLALPDWFGLPNSLESYVVESQKLTVLGCFEETKLIGFITLKPTSEKTLELYVLGILPTYNRQGIGNTMMQAVVAYAKTHGYYYLQVKTLAPEAKDEYYLKTYAFYRSLNFVDVEVLPLWDEWNPCQMMICKTEEVTCK